MTHVYSHFSFSDIYSEIQKSSPKGQKSDLIDKGYVAFSSILPVDDEEEVKMFSDNPFWIKGLAIYIHCYYHDSLTLTRHFSD